MAPKSSPKGKGVRKAGRPAKTAASQARFRANIPASVGSNGQLFFPSRHLARGSPKKIYKMSELGFKVNPDGLPFVSDVALSDPFHLFTEEAVNIMRDEIFQDVVQNEFNYSSDIAPLPQLRGYAPQHAPFTYQAWNHPQTLEILSEIAGLGLTTHTDYEIAHINMSTPGPKPLYTGENTAEKDAIVGWHNDSYPFVCVLMMSDTAGMEGGETALKNSKGEQSLVKGPGKGYAVVLQGREILHKACAAFGGKERITAVTSLRPASPWVRDGTVLNTVRGVSNLSELYGQVTDYQLENSAIRISAFRKQLAEARKTGNVKAKLIKAFLRNERQILKQLEDEIVDEDKVGKGKVDQLGPASPIGGSPPLSPSHGL